MPNISIIDTMALGEPRVVAAYLVGGKEHALIDMGYPTSAATIIGDLEKAGIEDVDYLLPRHVHCGSCGTLARMFPNARPHYRREASHRSHTSSRRGKSALWRS